MTDFTIIEAPSALGLSPGTVERLPEALLDAGLARRLDAARHARLAVPPYSAERDPVTHMLNAPRIRDFAIMLADLVEPVVRRGAFPVVLGGDCSIMLGNLLAGTALGGSERTTNLGRHTSTLSRTGVGCAALLWTAVIL